MKEQLKFRGDWTFTYVDVATGKVLSKKTIQNTVVNLGLAMVRDFLAGDVPDSPVAIGIGTDNTAVQITDVALGTEFTRATASITKPGSYQVKFAKTFNFGSGVSETIPEAGLFDNLTESGSIMFARVIVSPAKVISSSIDLIVEATITISRV